MDVKEINIGGEATTPPLPKKDLVIEDRAAYMKRTKRYIADRCSAWTPERRAEAAEKAREEMVKAKTLLRAKTATLKSRYLRKKGTSEFFVWTEILSKRGDMEEVSNELFENSKAGGDQPRQG